MAILGGTVLEVVVNILGSEPSQTLNPYIWQEVTKLRNAVRELAAAVDVINAAAQNVSYTDIGTLSSGIFLQNMTKVRVIAGEYIDAGVAVRFAPVGGTIRAYRTTWPLGADGFSESAVGAGVEGQFTLKGLVAYSRFQYFPASHVTTMDNLYCGGDQTNTRVYSHYRINTHFRKDNNYEYVGPIPGWLAWEGATLCSYDPSLAHPTYKYVGTDIGNIGGFLGTILMYLNPRA